MGIGIMAISKADAIKATQESAKKLVDAAEFQIDEILKTYSEDIGYVRVSQSIIDFRAPGVMNELYRRYSELETGWTIIARFPGQLDETPEGHVGPWLEFS
jgi:hypothetical protein